MIDTKTQPDLPENVAKINPEVLKKLLQAHLESPSEIQWVLEMETTKEKKFYAHPGFMLDPPTERYLSSSNMWDPHEHMTVTHTFWTTIKAKVCYTTKEGEKKIAEAQIHIHFFRSAGGLLCPSLIWIRKEEPDGPWQGPFPWGGKDYPIYYKNHDPLKPERCW